MGEIKGQILGVVLVVAIFGLVGGTLYTAFNNASKNVATKVEGVVDKDLSQSTFVEKALNHVESELLRF